MTDQFTEQLIKGRIAETVFERMFREETKYDIYPLGYEYTLPILKQVRDALLHQEHKATLERILSNFDNTPDYLLVKADKSSVYIVEVKYQSLFDEKRIVSAAKKINERWDPAWLFVATKEGFYFDSCHDIVNHNAIRPFDWIPQPTQHDYLELLKRMEP